MHPVTSGDLSVLLGDQQPPCVSIYLPMRKGFPGNRESPLRFRGLVGQAEDALRRKYPAVSAKKLLERFNQIIDDEMFWARRQDGLAVLGSLGAFHVFDLQRAAPEHLVVADTFHIKPLLRIVQSADQFHLLCLQRDAIRLYAGNRDGLHQIEPPNVPLTITDALGDEVVVQRKTQVPFGKSAGEARPAPRPPTAPPGHAATRDDAKLDTERFFRVIDKAVWEQLSRPSGHPLVVVAVPEQQSLFREITRNPQVLQAGVEASPAGLSNGELLERAWKCVEPHYLARLQKMIDDYHVAQPRHMASNDLETVARAARGGRVGILLIEAERVVPGSLDPATGAVRPGDYGDPSSSDLLDDLAELVVRMKGTVVVVPNQRMPTDTGLAAIFRF